MLAYKDMYNITCGILMAFKNNSDKRLLSVNHPLKKMNSFEQIFPVSKYSEWTRENFIIAVLYINFYKSPSSINSCIDLLRDLDKSDVLRFKNEIINYRTFLIQDIEKLKIDSEHINIDYMTNLYRNNRIKWYTYYFYIIVSGQDINKLLSSRINGHLLRKIKILLLYVTFSEKTMLLVKELLNDIIEM